MRKGANFSGHCPICGARPSAACVNKQGEKMPGVHFQRNTERRKAIAAAMYHYAPSNYAPRNTRIYTREG